MDRTPAFRSLRAGRRVGVPSSLGREPGSKRRALRFSHLVNEHRDDREGSLDRTGGSLRFAFRAGFHLLDELLSATSFTVACVDRPISFSRTGVAGQGSASSALFLRDCCGRAVPDG